MERKVLKDQRARKDLGEMTEQMVLKVLKDQRAHKDLQGMME